MNSILLADLFVGPASLIILIAGQAFWLWMLIDCMKTEGPRSEWRYVLFFGNIAGAIAYFIVRWLPSNPQIMPEFMRRWGYREKLWNAKAAARNIGNAHQYAVLGDIQLAMGDLPAAQTAFQTAIDKDAKNVTALWGLAQLTFQIKDFTTARTHLEALLKIDPQARFGEASLLYGKTLVQLQDWEPAKTHLNYDIRQWSHPEASLLLATLLQQSGETAAARDRLETMLARVEASPMYHHRNHQSTLRKARKLLKML